MEQNLPPNRSEFEDQNSLRNKSQIDRTHPPQMTGTTDQTAESTARQASASNTALVLRHSARAKTQHCPSCGAAQTTATSICLACGAYMPSKAAIVRCRRCGTQSSADLSICPGCGRELQPARKRSTSWIVPVLLVALFLLLIQQWRNSVTVGLPREQLATGWHWLQEVGERLDPQITIETIPAESAPSLAALPSTNGQRGIGPNGLNLSLFATATATAQSFLLTNPADIEQPSGHVPAIDEQGTVLEGIALTTTNSGFSEKVQLDSESVATATSPAVEIEPTVTSTPTSVPTSMPTATPIATATEEPTSAVLVLAPTRRPTPTRVRPTPTEPVPTASPTAQGEPEQPVLAAEIEDATVDAGDTEQTAEQEATREESTLLQPTAAASAVPPTATAVPPTAAPTSPTVVYKIRAGDVPATIAQRYDITVAELLTTNGLTIADARRLRVGQELIIPQGGGDIAAVPATATPEPTLVSATFTPTAQPPTETPASPIRVDAPQLRSPESGTFLSCGSENSLIWLPVSFLREEDRYLLHLGFLNGYNTDGSENVVWILEQQQPANATIWTMDEGLCSLAPQNFGRQWRWYVEVVEPTDTGWQAVSPPSSIWTFSWN